MDCSKCAWGTDREACRACRAEQEEAKLTEVNDYQLDIDRIKQRLHEILDGGLPDGHATAAKEPDPYCVAYMATAGDEHRTYINHRVDPPEYQDYHYGMQN